MIGAGAPLVRVGALATHKSCVLDVHEVVAHGLPPACADGLTSVLPKPKPRNESIDPPEAGVLSDETAVNAMTGVGDGVGVGVGGGAHVPGL
jgi:hypothetical protein